MSLQILEFLLEWSFTKCFQPDRVSDALNSFMLNLVESIVIVILLLVFMGFKSGMIIGFNLVICTWLSSYS